MTRTAENRRTYLKLKARRLICDVPTIPDALADVIANNTLSASQEVEADAAIARAREELHNRREFKEDRRGACEVMSYATGETKRGFPTVRCV